MTPVSKRDSGVLEDGPDPNGELLVAATTSPEEPTIPLAGLAILHLIHLYIPTAGAAGCISPSHILKEFDGVSLVSTSPWDGFDDFRLVLGYLAHIRLTFYYHYT